MDSIFALIQAVLLIFLPAAPVSVTPMPSGQVSEWKKPKSSEGLEKVVTQALSGTEGEYKIYIRHLATGESYAKDQNDVLRSASMYKAWLAVGVLEELRTGKLEEKQILSETIAELNKWAGLTEETAELTSGEATYTVREALRRMIAVSHNYSAFLLTREVGNPKVQEILKSHKLSDIHFVRPPTTSAAEMARFLEKVYRGKFFDDENYSQRLRDLLAANELNDGLPKLLPNGTRVEHKTGELNDFKHDCGIVYSRGGDYVICIMTETEDPLAAEARIADVSLAVYNYFN